MRRFAVLAVGVAVAGCGAEGEAVECDSADGVVWNGVSYLALDADTRFARFASSIPFLARGDRVRVPGHGCRGKGMIPRRTEPQP